MVTKEIPYFDMGQICDSGQCFRMERKGENRYSVIAGEHYLEIEQDGEKCTFNCDEDIFEAFWKDYFDLGTDYGAYIASINPRDKYLTEAAQMGGGIRILEQDLWEMIVSFLISQQNNIVRIRRCIRNLCERYGKEKQTPGGGIYYTFPTPEILAVLEEDALKECNLGYRSKYVVRTAGSIMSGEVSLEKIQHMSYRKAREELLRLYGVGEKVADCICLFSLHKLEAFPIDTHIRQALDLHYKRGFPMRRYRGYQGVMQQYIFYRELWESKKQTPVKAMEER